MPQQATSASGGPIGGETSASSITTSASGLNSGTGTSGSTHGTSGFGGLSSSGLGGLSGTNAIGGLSGIGGSSAIGGLTGIGSGSPTGGLGSIGGTSPIGGLLGGSGGTSGMTMCDPTTCSGCPSGADCICVSSAIAICAPTVGCAAGTLEAVCFTGN
jgi:hypothetical protein